MKNRQWAVGALVMAMVGGPGVAGAAEPQGFFEQYIQKHLEIGARFNHFELQDTRRYNDGELDNGNNRGNYLGSIWGLDEEQSYWPRLYAQYMFIPYFGVGITYDGIEAATVDWGNLENTETAGDGDVETMGTLFYLVGCFPNQSRVRPFLELGYAFYSADFAETDYWASIAPGYRIEVDDTEGWFWGIGCNVRVYDNWNVELYYRQMRENIVDARAYFTPGPKVGRYGEFPMEYDMWSLGVSYRF